MKYDVRHQCGHLQEHELFGPGKARDSKLEWLKTTLCSDCYKAQIEADRKAKAEIDAQSNSESGLPQLEGSDRQIAWAETIRATWKAEADQIVATIVEGRKTAPDAAQAECDAVIGDVAKVLRQTSAKYWIDGRNEGAKARLRRLQTKRIADAALASA